MTNVVNALAIEEFLVKTYRELHSYPELSHQEKATSARIAKWLGDIGLEVQQGVGGYGVVGLLRGSQIGARTFALRADMDALPLDEASGVSFASRNPGRMHACGHDAHMAMALGAAKLLKAQESSLNHNVKFVFQPAEEYTPPHSGAKAMIEAGVLSDPQVSSMFSLHVWPGLPTGQIALKKGVFAVAIDVFDFELLGAGGHGALPHETSDVIVGSAQAVMSCQTIVSRRLPPMLPAVLTIGSIQGGSKANIIPSKVTCKGSCRYVDPAQGVQIREELDTILKGVSQAYHIDYQLHYETGYPPTVNDERLTIHVQNSAAKILGHENVLTLEHPMMFSEDFSYFTQKVPSCMFLVGAGVNGSLSYGLHSAHFRIDERALPVGASVLAQAILDLDAAIEK